MFGSRFRIVPFACSYCVFRIQKHFEKMKRSRSRRNVNGSEPSSFTGPLLSTTPENCFWECHCELPHAVHKLQHVTTTRRRLNIFQESSSRFYSFL